MARGRASHGGGGGGALLACDRAIEKRSDYEKSVKEIHARCIMIAESLRPDGRLGIDEIFKAEHGDGADEWLLDCRNRLKAIAQGNAKRMNDIEYFVDGVKKVRSDVQRHQADQGNGEEGNETDAPDYERAVNEAVEKVRSARDATAELESHDMSTSIRTALGEKVQKKVRNSRGGYDEDDDLEIVQNAVEDEQTLKCPITGMFFVNPVKNKVCGHTYDMMGLDQMIKNGKTTCPVPGCSNRGVTKAQVEEDTEMKLKVQRHRKREEAEKKRRALEEEDEEDGEGGGYTVLE